jgi:hypothetical protein
MLDVVFFGRYAKKKKRKCCTKLCNSVLNPLKKDKGKESVRSKRLRAGWNNDFLLQLITNYNAFALYRQIKILPKFVKKLLPKKKLQIRQCMFF